jgi:16S rRNA (guanine527-N7)-methyltransferase
MAIFSERLAYRCLNAGIEIPPSAVAPLERYFSLLAKWNATINLTALVLVPPSDEAIDRLIVEPLAAIPYLPFEWTSWFDLGSGGGSPALPLRIVRQNDALILVEAKTRKAAFLREAVRSLGLAQVTVENTRFEMIAEARRGIAQLVTVRAVRTDVHLAKAASGLLAARGRLLVFGSSTNVAQFIDFVHVNTVQLLPNRSSFLSIYSRIEA